MKRTVLALLMLVIALAGFSQPNVLKITGQLTHDSTGAPIPNHPVLIQGDSASPNCPSGMVYSQIVMTNLGGFYFKQIPLFVNSPSNFIVSTQDCYGTVHSVTLPAVAGIDTVNFSICSNATPPPPPPCNAQFLAIPYNNLPGKVKFNSNSIPLTALHTWDFGDGSTSNLKHPLHTFAAPGTYNVCLVISQNNINCNDTFCMVVQVDSVNTPPPVPCNAEFSTKAFPKMPGKIKFISKSSPMSAAHSWDFGDGNTSSLKHPMHNYATPGNYNVCLVISQPNASCADTFCMNVLVDTLITPPPVPCQANFIVKQFPYMPGKVKFISKSMPFASLHTWDFGDGTSSIQRHPMHIYTAPGTYNVCLVISNNTGLCADTFCMNVLVDTFNAPPPAICQANFSYFIDSITGAVHFLDQSLPAFHYSHWDFGDGATSQLKNPVHAYTAPGSYTVTLVMGCMNPSNMCTDTASQVVIIPVVKSTQGSQDLKDSSFGHIGQVYPNPSSTDARIDIDMTQAGKVNVQIRDLSGKIVFEGSETLENGTNTLSLPAGKLASGYYTILLRHETGDTAVRKLSRID